MSGDDVGGGWDAHKYLRVKGLTDQPVKKHSIRVHMIFDTPGLVASSVNPRQLGNDAVSQLYAAVSLFSTAFNFSRAVFATRRGSFVAQYSGLNTSNDKLPS